MEDTSKPLWRAQDDLPSLPIPTLEESCKRYLASVKALMSPEEYRNTKNAVKEFLKPDGIGRTLQRRLKQRQKEQGGNNSWLQEWWNEYSYLGYREPNVVYVSYFYHFRNRVLGESTSQTRQASVRIFFRIVEFTTSHLFNKLEIHTRTTGDRSRCSGVQKSRRNVYVRTRISG